MLKTLIPMKKVNEWTRKEFEALPYAEGTKDIDLFDAIVILPKRQLHESTYRMLDFVIIKNGMPTCRLGFGSDMVHLFQKSFWRIDCLAKSGLFRVFVQNHKLTISLPGVKHTSLELIPVK